MNILMLSVGTRNLLVRAFREALSGGGRVIATDGSALAPALYEADCHYVVPLITEEDYIPRILDICRKEEVTALFSLIDPELSLLAGERERFENRGIRCLVSSYDLCEKSLDKYKMYELLCDMGISTPRTFLHKSDFLREREQGSIGYPLFVKPRYGSASLCINRIGGEGELETLLEVHEDLIIQEAMTGEEYGADVYVDLLSGKCVSIFLKKKLKMRAGETDKSVSVKDERAFALLRSFTEEAGYRGMLDVDLFFQDGTWYISEVNPRFGGGYPHAYACGVNFPKKLLHNLRGMENEREIGAYEEGVYMMKYNDICIRKGE